MSRPYSNCRQMFAGGCCAFRHSTAATICWPVLLALGVSIVDQTGEKDTLFLSSDGHTRINSLEA